MLTTSCKDLAADFSYPGCYSEHVHSEIFFPCSASLCNLTDELYFFLTNPSTCMLMTFSIGMKKQTAEQSEIAKCLNFITSVYM